MSIITDHLDDTTGTGTGTDSRRPCLTAAGSGVFVLRHYRYGRDDYHHYEYHDYHHYPHHHHHHHHVYLQSHPTTTSVILIAGGIFVIDITTRGVG